MSTNNNGSTNEKLYEVVVQGTRYTNVSRFSLQSGHHVVFWTDLSRTAPMRSVHVRPGPD